MSRKIDISNLVSSFRESRGQVTTQVDTRLKSKRGKPTNAVRSSKGDYYRDFLYKYQRLRESIDSFGTRDLMYLFREKASEAGVKYVIANYKRDMAVFKKLMDSYTPREIALMIEFIFHSNQNYLDIHITQPTVLISTWCNTVYRDSVKWANDEYQPTVKQDRNANREWGSTPEGEVAKINSWE